MVKVGIVGGTGYTGVELLRLLAQHPEAEVAVITSRSEAGVKVADMYPNLRGHYDSLAFSVPDVSTLGRCDVVFFATPNGIAMQEAVRLVEAGVRVIDLAADFRIKDIAEWEKWYGMTHASPQLVAEAVYGLPEINRDAVRTARVVANPGCYPTAVQLGFMPLVEAGLVDLGHLVGSAEPVEEVHEGNAGFQRGGMGNLWLIVDERPDKVGKRFAALFHGQEGAGVADDGLDFSPMADNPGILQQPLDIFIPHRRHAHRIELVKSLAIVLPFF